METQQHSMATISADNLSAHQLGGFTGSFSNGRVCRYCMVHYEDHATITSEDCPNCVIRNPDLHHYHINALQQNPNLAGSTYGIWRDCCFAELDYLETPTIHHFLQIVYA